MDIHTHAHIHADMHTFTCTQFSKYLSGCALLHQHQVKMLPHWFQKDGTISMDKGVKKQKNNLIVRSQDTYLLNLLQVCTHKYTHTHIHICPCKLTGCQAIALSTNMEPKQG